MWHVIIEHEDNIARAVLIWRFLIATMMVFIHMSRCKFYFHVQRSLKHTIKYRTLICLFCVKHNEIEDRSMREDLIWRLGFCLLRWQMKAGQCAE